MACEAKGLSSVVYWEYLQALWIKCMPPFPETTQMRVGCERIICFWFLWLLYLVYSGFARHAFTPMFCLGFENPPRPLSQILCDFSESYDQWWSVTKYNYFVTVLKYIFQGSVLYWSSFILSNFYFYFTTLQSIRSVLFTSLHFIKHIVSHVIHHVLRDAETVSDSWTNSFFSMNLFNRFANRNKRFIHEIAMIRLQLFSSRKLTDSNDPFRASLLQWTELASKEPEDLVSARYWCCEK